MAFKRNVLVHLKLKQSICICGAPRSGRTTIAKAIVHSPKAEIYDRFWLDAEDYKSVDGVEQQIAKHLQISDLSTGLAAAMCDRVRKVMFVILHVDHSFDSLLTLLAVSGVRLIVTTATRHWQSGFTVLDARKVTSHLARLDTRHCDISSLAQQVAWFPLIDRLRIVKELQQREVREWDPYIERYLSKIDLTARFGLAPEAVAQLCDVAWFFGNNSCARCTLATYTLVVDADDIHPDLLEHHLVVSKHSARSGLEVEVEVEVDGFALLLTRLHRSDSQQRVSNRVCNYLLKATKQEPDEALLYYMVREVMCLQQYLDRGGNMVFPNPLADGGFWQPLMRFAVEIVSAQSINLLLQHGHPFNWVKPSLQEAMAHIRMGALCDDDALSLLSDLGRIGWYSPITLLEGEKAWDWLSPRVKRRVLQIAQQGSKCVPEAAVDTFLLPREELAALCDPERWWSPALLFDYRYTDQKCSIEAVASQYCFSDDLYDSCVLRDFLPVICDCMRRHAVAFELVRMRSVSGIIHAIEMFQQCGFLALSVNDARRELESEARSLLLACAMTNPAEFVGTKIPDECLQEILDFKRTDSDLRWLDEYRAALHPTDRRWCELVVHTAKQWHGVVARVHINRSAMEDIVCSLLSQTAPDADSDITRISVQFARRIAACSFRLRGF
eukprot:TRINITY_DN1011_c0_g1_i1.p1 TRINITY_DN1011_c0_g1~~TRINITY_DN1011_c0_g1_i1.p1  ORF type:complete len:669 (+),score=101.46 TRINITY_DN1011_c0_g1_i1:1067-3073(+)